MKQLSLIILSMVLGACGPISVKDLHDYQLQGVANKRLAANTTRLSLLIEKPSAAAGYDSSNMLYMQRPYQLEAFAKNSWVAEPAAMLQALLLQSAQNTHFFRAVVNAPFSGNVDLGLKTEIVQFQQEFFRRPSQQVLVIKANLIAKKRQRVMASQQFVARVNAPYDTPYGGVIAANQAVKQVLGQMMVFVVKHSRRA